MKSAAPIKFIATIAVLLALPWNAAAEVPSVKSVERRRLAVQKSLSNLPGVRIEAPPTLVEGERYHLSVTAPLPVKLRKGIDLDTLPLEHGKLTTICDWPEAVTFKELPVALGLDVSHCSFGVLEGDDGYSLEWLYDGIAKQAGHYEVKGALVGNQEAAAKIRVDHDFEEQFYERAAEIFRLIRPAILVALGLLLFVVTDSVALFLYAFGWMVVAAGGGVLSNVADAAAILVIVSNQAGKKSFFDTLRSLPRWASKLKDTLSKKIDGSGNPGAEGSPSGGSENQGEDGGLAQEKGGDSVKESKSLMATFIDRTKELIEGSARRARWQLFASCVLALIAFVVLVLPLRRLLSEATDNEGAFRRMLVAGIPYVAIFICLILGARIFVQQYRLSLDDHRHFEESLRIREWQNLVLQGELDGLEKRKELFALFEAPAKPPSVTENGTGGPSKP